MHVLLQQLLLLVVYVSVELSEPPLQPSTVGTLPASASSVDDGPASQVHLPFPFTFYAQPYRRLFISPDGNVRFAGEEPCCTPQGKCSFVLSGACSLSAYRNVAGPLVADFVPGQSPTAPGRAVSYAVREDLVLVRWEALPFFANTSLTASFSAVFRANDSRVYFLYGDVPDGAVPAQEWFAGLHAPSGAEAADLELPTAAVRTNATVVFCGLPARWCLTPLRGPVGTTLRVRPSSTAAARGLLCLGHDFQLECAFGDGPTTTTTPASVSPDGSEVLCAVPASSSGSGTVSVSLQQKGGAGTTIWSGNGLFTYASTSVADDACVTGTDALSPQRLPPANATFAPLPPRNDTVAVMPLSAVIAEAVVPYQQFMLCLTAVAVANAFCC